MADQRIDSVTRYVTCAAEQMVFRRAFASGKTVSICYESYGRLHRLTGYVRKFIEKPDDRISVTIDSRETP